MKELNLDELENVTGGTDTERNYKYNVKYQDPATGEYGLYELEGTYRQTSGFIKAKKAGENWCAENNKVFVGLRPIE